MKVHVQGLLWICCGICLIIALTGCSMFPKEKIASSTTDFNLVVEKAQNEMLLLNIVRASKRRPMYFTGFNLLRGNMSYNFQTGSLTIPFGKIGKGLDGSYSIAPSVGFSTQPSFDVGVLDTQEFTNGILTPVPIKTFEYYWNQGWPKEMLLHLFIQRIETASDGEPIENYPENHEKFKKFQDELRLVDWDNCKIVAEEKLDLIGPKISSSSITNLQHLVETQKAGLMLMHGEEGGKEWFQLASQKIDYVFQCKTDQAISKTINVMTSDSWNEKPLDKKNASVGKVYVRSPEAILYYLGQILRAETDAKNPLKIRICKKTESGSPIPEATLFAVYRATDNDIVPAVAVDYDGSKYIIKNDLLSDANDGCRIDRSMHVLSLVSQLIGLQKSSKTAPVTGVVNLIGR